MIKQHFVESLIMHKYSDDKIVFTDLEAAILTNSLNHTRSRVSSKMAAAVVRAQPFWAWRRPSYWRHEIPRDLNSWLMAASVNTIVWITLHLMKSKIHIYIFLVPMLFYVCVCVQCQCALTIVLERHRIAIVVFLGRISGHFFSFFPLVFSFFEWLFFEFFLTRNAFRTKKKIMPLQFCQKRVQLYILFL